MTTPALYDAASNTWALPNTQMEVEVILSSKREDDLAPPIYTIRMRYPRIIHAELMTHRVFSRNARSSRAVPVARMIEEVRNDPFVPWHWGKNQKGMQAGEECDELLTFDADPIKRERAWTWAAFSAADYAAGFMDAGYHKQICNRLLEPFMYIDVLVTSTRWANFLWLRDHKDAEPHLQDLARMVGMAIDNAEVQTLKPGEWHLPYVTDKDKEFFSNNGMHDWFNNEVLLKISSARSARISYAPFDGDASYERELERYDSLVSSDRVHASPLEHQATPDDQILHSHEYEKGHFESFEMWQHLELSGNLSPGWIQYRKLVPNEVAL